MVVGCYYWQPAAIWRLLSWLANPGDPAMSPAHRRGNRHPFCCVNSGKWEANPGNPAMSSPNKRGDRHPLCWINSGKRKARKGRGNAWRWSSMQKYAHCKHYRCLVLGRLSTHRSGRAHGVLVHAHDKAQLTTTHEGGCSLLLILLNCI